MVDENPYQPPQANLIDESRIDLHEPAGRWQRLGAAFIDGLIALVLVGVPLAYTFDTFSMARKGIRPPWSVTVVSAAIGFAVFALVHGYFLKTAGQTIGKKLLGIRIADLEGRVPPLTRVLLLRYLPVRLLGLVPLVGPALGIIDALFVFRGDRRCIHDFIAGTKVVKVH